jgi:hypothetical protein
MIEHVESVQTKFRVHPFVVLEMFRERQVRIDETRTANGIAAQGAFRVLAVLPRRVRLGNLIQRQ